MCAASAGCGVGFVWSFWFCDVGVGWRRSGTLIDCSGAKRSESAFDSVDVTDGVTVYLWISGANSFDTPDYCRPVSVEEALSSGDDFLCRMMFQILPSPFFTLFGLGLGVASV